MATERQKKLAINMVENLKRKTPLNKKELLVSSGYDLTTAEKQVPYIFEQKGVQEELKALGFTQYNATKVVSEIMLNPEVDANARLKATDQVFKVEGSYAPEKTQALNLNIDGRISANPELEAIRVKYIEELKSKLNE